MDSNSDKSVMNGMLNDLGREITIFESPICIHHGIEEQARYIPERTAIIFRDRHLTYRTLDSRAEQLASDLRQIGVGPEKVVGICIDRSLEMMIGILGVLKAGGAYLPLDPTFPRDRIDFMLKDSEAIAIIVGKDLAGRFSDQRTAVIILDVRARQTESADSIMIKSGADHNLAYLMYTSGSTGTPKGVMVEHRNVVSLFSAMDRVLGREPGVWLAVTSISFDISVLELLWTLGRGFTVVIQPEDEKMKSAGSYSIAEQLKRHHVTHLQCTPTLARILTRSPDTLSAMKSLKFLLLGGEVLPVPLATQLSRTVAGDILNMYGPTETTIWSTAFKLAGDQPTIPIGLPLENTSVWLLDDQLRAVAPGATGELYIGGAGVARGYWKRSQLTEERFIRYPAGMDPHERLYKTGDLVRCRSDGQLEFIGRVDHQVKIRGFRIELGEIESVLCREPGVECAVASVFQAVPGNPQIVAYIVCKPGMTGIAKELQEYAKQMLPDYMIPQLFVFLDALPLTPNGKVDRNALPVPNIHTAAAYVVGESGPAELQAVIAKVWQDVLGIEKVSLHQNLFDLGASSLTIAEACAELSRLLNRELKIVELFTYPTVNSLAIYLRNGTNVAGQSVNTASRASARRQSARNRGKRIAAQTGSPD